MTTVRTALITGIILLTLVVTSACERVQLPDDAEPDASPALDDEQAPSAGTATAVPIQPEPTSMPTGSLLQIHSVSARQVVLWDDELPAEYAATRFSLFRRTESNLWQYVGTLPVRGQIVASPDDPETLYIGNHPPCPSDDEPVSFYRSNDGGQTWHRIEDANNIRPIMVLPEDPEIIIGSRCGLVISQDGGRTWERHSPESEFDVTRLSNTPIGLFGVFTAEGQTSYLRRVDISDPDNPVFEDEILSFWGTGAVHATQDRIFLGDSSGVHFSDDGGRTWSFTREGLEDVVTSVDPMEEEIPERELQAGIGIYSILPHPSDSSRVFLGTIRGLYLSEDGGETWGKIQEVEDYPVQELIFSMDGAILYAKTSEGVMVLHNP